jgi:putative membrane protein
MTDPTTVARHPLDTATTLAFERTRIAYDRTAMAWVRTAASLITFGFSVYKFFQLETAGRELPGSVIGSREFALALIAVGLLALVVGALEHRRDLAFLRAQYPGMPRSGTSVLAWLIAALGVLAFLAVIFRG